MTLAFEKPRKEDRKRTKIDTSDFLLPKKHFDRDGDYKAWVRNHRCLMHWYSRCEGDVEAAHLQRGGRGIKGSDYSCIPLCGREHHLLLDGNSLDHEVMAYLWMRTWEFLAEWHRRAK